MSLPNNRQIESLLCVSLCSSHISSCVYVYYWRMLLHTCDTSAKSSYVCHHDQHIWLINLSIINRYLRQHVTIHGGITHVHIDSTAVLYYIYETARTLNVQSKTTVVLIHHKELWWHNLIQIIFWLCRILLNISQYFQNNMYTKKHYKLYRLIIMCS